jgi:hypothetical protein
MIALNEPVASFGHRRVTGAVINHGAGFADSLHVNSYNYGEGAMISFMLLAYAMDCPFVNFATAR